MVTENPRISGTTVRQPAFEGGKRPPKRQTGGQLPFRQTISDNGLLCQPEVGFSGRAGQWLQPGQEVFTLTGYRKDRRSSLSAEDLDPAGHELLPTGPNAQGFF